MAGQSKLHFCSDSVEYNCYEIGHTWSSNCPLAIYMFTVPIVKHAFKIYAIFYLANFILRKEMITKKSVKNLLRNIFQSTFFLGLHGFFHLFFTCVLRHSIGRFYLSTAAFLPGFLGSLVAILSERKNRRSALALYVANVASETLFRMLVNRGVISPIANGEVIMFSFAMALYMHHLKVRGSNDILSKFLIFLFGNNEGSAKTSDGAQENCSSFEVGVSEYTKYKLRVRNFWRNCIVHFQRLPKHISCNHKHSCFYSCFETLTKAFSLGFGINVALVLSQYVVKQKLNLSSIRQQVFNIRHLDLGLFLGGFTGIYKGLSCILRWYSNGDERWHALPAGFLAGISLHYFRSSTLVLYVIWRVIDIYYRSGANAGFLPIIPGANIILYAMSCGILFHAAVVEPHNVKPTYYKFLQRATGGLVDQVNRTLLSDVYPGSNTMFPNYVPNLDKTKMTPLGIERMRRRQPNF